MTPHTQVTKRINAETIFLYGYMAVFFIIAMMNIGILQTIPPLYFHFINDEKQAIATYLIDIRKLPLFSSELIRYKNKYGVGIEKEVFKIEEARRKNILKLETALKENPNSRDLLYNLSILYHEEGDETKAVEYLSRAKEIDPSVRN